MPTVFLLFTICGIGGAIAQIRQIADSKKRYVVNIAPVAHRISSPNPVEKRNKKTSSSLAILPPNISYPTPQTYVINTPIAPLASSNSGGAVPAGIYGQVSTFAGGRAPVTFDATGTGAGFNFPSGIGMDAAGNIYVTDFGSGAIRKITPAAVVTTIANVPNPSGLTVDAQGNIFVTAFQKDQIYKITPNGTTSVFAGSGLPAQTDGIGAAASFDGPGGIAIDASENLYVADQQNSDIRKITPTGVVTTAAGGSRIGGANNGPAATATFYNPDGVVVDNNGNIYVADTKNNLIRKITSAGVVSTYAGNGYIGSTDGWASVSTFNYPTSVTVDASGNLYVADYNNNLIREITTGGKVITIAGSGTAGNTNGIGRSASFNAPLGLFYDPNGNIFITDAGNSLIRKITLTGYTIDKPLPAGLSFDGTTGIISGTPIAPSPATDYTITGYNATGSSSTVVNIQITRAGALKPSIITFPPITNPVVDANNNVNPNATSTNNETPITYTSSDTSVAVILPNGLIHVKAPGVTIITASQIGNANYSSATSVMETLTVMETQAISFPALGSVSLCASDFSVAASSSNSTIPLNYSSSNTAVATISNQGLIHIIGTGTTSITVSQAGNTLFIPAAPQSQVLTVSPAPTVSVKITPDYFDACAGTAVTYTATVAGGSNPIFQWKVNGQNAGTNDSTLTSTVFQTGDKIICTITSGTGCTFSTATSNAATLTADPLLNNSVTITSTAINNIISPNEKVTFTAKTAYPAAGITTIAYQWQVNGINAGTNSQFFTTSLLNNGDVINCEIVTYGKCIGAPVALSNLITITLETQVIVINTFTPNGDGINDTWVIPSLSEYINCAVNVFTRHGMLVYNSIGYPNAWDGTYGGKAVPAGTYYYVIDLKNGKSKLSGFLTILR
jgi:gliding motility-associated-like protein